MSEEAAAYQLERLEELVEKGRLEEAASLVAAANPTDAADRLQDLEPEDAVAILRRIQSEKAADILEELPDDLAADALEEMPAPEAAKIVAELISDEEADILGEVSDKQVEAIIGHLDTDEAQIARELLAYDEDTAGGLMQKEYLSVSSHLLATDARRHLQSMGEEGEAYPYSYIYVVDEHGKFEGVLSLRALLFAQPTTPISTLINRDAVFVNTSTPASDLVQLFRRKKLLSVPVVDNTGTMLGIVSQDDAMRYAREESDEEFLRFTGIAGGEEVRDMPLQQRARRRLIWLVIKMILNAIPASVIAHFTHTPAFALLAPILPIISDMGGSGGSQAIAVSIRELSLGRVKTADFTWVLWKEIGIGILNGIALGSLLGLGAFWYTKNLPLACIVAFSMLASTVVAVAVGGLMPLILRKLRVDPAVASSPILTMVTDTTGFYFTLALALVFYRPV